MSGAGVRPEGAGRRGGKLRSSWLGYCHGQRVACMADGGGDYARRLAVERLDAQLSAAAALLQMGETMAEAAIASYDEFVGRGPCAERKGA